MSRSILDTPIEYLKGVGPERAKTLKTELNIHQFGDLLTYFPFRYVDRTKFHKVSELDADMPYVQLKGRITHMEMVGKPRSQRLVANFEDETGSVELVWFQGAKWIVKSLKPNTEYILFGKPNLFNRKINITHPEMEDVNEARNEIQSALQAVYYSTEKLKAKGLHTKGIGRVMKNLLLEVRGKIPEILSPDILQNNRLMSREQAFMQVHFPTDIDNLNAARHRLKFEELFYTQLRLVMTRERNKKDYKGYVFGDIGEHFNTFYKNHLPFELTNAQKRVLKEIRADVGSGKHMNRLMQGDVGSGKTIVALMTMLMALDNGFQACMMAPTEILAQQHYQSISDLLIDMPITVKLLTGSTKTAERNEIHAALASGELHILIGTHALIEPAVQFKNLGMAIVDEQHRFGVQQRAKLWAKSANPPHVLVMTATPIPRTLAMTLYGDLDTSIIDEMPPGRKPIRTEHRNESKRLAVFGFMKEQIALGRQIYVVFPLIEESEAMDYKNLFEGQEAIVRAFPPPEYRIAIMHGRMKPDEKDAEMKRFVENKAQIMIATTVIEVGVNVPNASVMVIESAERFGLSQLHQLRGRVGRGADQSYCILMTSYKLTNEARIRLETMCRTNDGFEIADVDMRLRGPGDMAGTQQSGLPNFKISNLAKDGQIVMLSRNVAEEVLKEDPALSMPKNQLIRAHLIEVSKSQPNWSRIS